MYCSNCGKKAGEQDSFCSGCGKKLGIEEVENIEVPSDVGMDNLMQSEKNMKEVEGLRGKVIPVRKKLKIDKEMLNSFLKIGVIGCTSIFVLIEIKYWLYLYSGNVAIEQIFYIALACMLRVLIITSPMLLVIVPEKKVRKWVVGIVWGYFLISKLYELVDRIRNVMEVRERHLKDLADDSYRVYGYEAYYQKTLTALLISFGIILGYVLIIFIKKDRKLLQRVIYILLGMIAVWGVCICFSPGMRMGDVQEYYIGMLNCVAAIRICLFGMWFCVRKCRDTEEEKCFVKDVEEK